MTYVRRAIVQGKKDSGAIVDVHASDEGHLEVAIHGPRLPHAAVHTETLDTIVEGDAINGLNDIEHKIFTGSNGYVLVTGSLIQCNTGTSNGGFAQLQSRKRIRGRAGKGVITRFGVAFGTPTSNNVQIAGFGHSESGVYFGYDGTNFGIFHVPEATREIRELRLTTKSSTVENVTVTLNGVATNVPVTNGVGTVNTAYEISNGTYDGWVAMQLSSSVFFLANSSGDKDGTYSVIGSTLSGSFVRLATGSFGIETWISQSSWNGDRLDGTGGSGVVLDPQKINQYQIEMGSGAGSIDFKVFVEPIDGTANANNTDAVKVHTLQGTNSLTSPLLKNPSGPFNCTTYSQGSTTSVGLNVVNWALLSEGLYKPVGNRVSVANTSINVNASGYIPIFSVRCDYVYNSRVVQQVFRLLSFHASVKHNQPAVVFVLRNAALTGANFTRWSSYTPFSYDTSATLATIADNNRILMSDAFPETGDSYVELTNPITIQPGEVLTFAARTNSGTATYVNVSGNFRDDG